MSERQLDDYVRSSHVCGTLGFLDFFETCSTSTKKELTGGKHSEAQRTKEPRCSRFLIVGHPWNTTWLWDIAPRRSTKSYMIWLFRLKNKKTISHVSTYINHNEHQPIVFKEKT